LYQLLINQRVKAFVLVGLIVFFGLLFSKPLCLEDIVFYPQNLRLEQGSLSFSVEDIDKFQADKFVVEIYSGNQKFLSKFSIINNEELSINIIEIFEKYRIKSLNYDFVFTVEDYQEFLSSIDKYKLIRY